MIVTKGVVHFTIAVSDPDRSEAFYGDVLGLEVVQKIPSVGMVFLTSGDDYIILTKSKTPINPNPGKEFLVHHAFRIDVDKYDGAIAHLKEHGVAVEQLFCDLLLLYCRSWICHAMRLQAG